MTLTSYIGLTDAYISSLANDLSLELHYGVFTTVLLYYFFFGVVFFDVFGLEPQILLRFAISSLVSSIGISLTGSFVVGPGFFRCKSLKSLDFLAELNSSFKLFLNGIFFNLMVPYIMASLLIKVKGQVYQNFSIFFKRLGP